MTNEIKVLTAELECSKSSLADLSQRIQEEEQRIKQQEEAVYKVEEDINEQEKHLGIYFVYIRCYLEIKVECVYKRVFAFLLFAFKHDFFSFSFFV